MTLRGLTSVFVVALSMVALAGCDKAKKDDADAAAAAVAAAAAAVDAATAVVAVAVVTDAGDPGDAGDAGVAAVDASVKVVVPAHPVAKPDPPTCQAARSAKLRKSPATAALEAQCRAAGGTP
jgi:hypothetical protein